MSKILVTGGAGFIGSHLVDVLVEKRHEVIVLDDLSSGKRENVNKKAVFIEGDIRDDLSGLFEKEKFDYVFHLAAQINVRESLKNSRKDAEINILGSLNLMENCARYGVKKFIFSSSGGAIYSSDAELPCSEGAEVKPESPYGVAKLAVENYLRIAKKTKGLDYVSLRYSNVYGQRQNSEGEAGVVAIFISKILNGENLKVFGDGEQTRDFVFVGDVVNANLMALGRDLSGEFNVSTGKETSVNNIIELLKEISGRDFGVEHVECIKGELRRSCLSSEKLEGFGWNAETDLENGLRKTFESFS